MNHAFRYKEGNGIFIQVGAGAGDLDVRANCRDGFTEFIKMLPRKRIQKIILIEPNPMNLDLLRECWKDYPEAVIYQHAIVPKTMPTESLEFFYCPADAPHYQVASLKIEHVQKHYGETCEIKSFSVPTKTLEQVVKDLSLDAIELLALDIEGIDGEVLLDIDFESVKAKFISFEHHHLGDKQQDIMDRFNRYGYVVRGNGLDVNGLDTLVEQIAPPLLFCNSLNSSA